MPADNKNPAKQCVCVCRIDFSPFQSLHLILVLDMLLNNKRHALISLVSLCSLCTCAGGHEPERRQKSSTQRKGLEHKERDGASVHCYSSQNCKSIKVNLTESFTQEL